MKLFEASFLSLFCSLFAGAFLFFGLPVIVEYITSDGQLSLFKSEGMIILIVMYIIYVVIQLVLSVLNWIQARHLDLSGELDPSDRRTLYNFFLAEFSLYLIVFVIAIALMREVVIIPFVFAFSIPYAICCTASVFIFRYFLKRMQISEALNAEAGAGEELVNSEEDI